MARRRRIPLSDSPSTSHLSPYQAKAKRNGRRRLPKVGESLEVADGKPVPGFQVKTSTGPLWKPLATTGATTMRVVRLKRNQELEGARGFTVAECELAGEPWPVWAYFKDGQRVA